MFYLRDDGVSGATLPVNGRRCTWASSDAKRGTRNMDVAGFPRRTRSLLCSSLCKRPHPSVSLTLASLHTKLSQMSRRFQQSSWSCCKAWSLAGCCSGSLASRPEACWFRHLFILSAMQNRSPQASFALAWSGEPLMVENCFMFLKRLIFQCILCCYFLVV